MLKKWVFRLGSDPKLRLKRFLCGLALFVLAVIFIATGYYGPAILQLIGLLILAIALFFAAWGYLGIFANRFAQVLERASPKDDDPDLWK